MSKHIAALAAVLFVALAAGCGTTPKQARKELRGRYEALWAVAKQEARESCRESGGSPMLTEAQILACETSMTNTNYRVLQAKQENAESAKGG
jgi:hypothetical protein